MRVELNDARTSLAYLMPSPVHLNHIKLASKKVSSALARAQEARSCPFYCDIGTKVAEKMAIHRVYSSHGIDAFASSATSILKRSTPIRTMEKYHKKKKNASVS